MIENSSQTVKEILDDIHSIRLKLHTEAEYSLIK